MQADATESAGRLLTVRQAAAQLQTSTATVYALCEGGALEHVRISTNAIRIRSADLARFIRDREVHR